MERGKPGGGGEERERGPLLEFRRPGGVDADRVDVCEDDVRAGGVFLEMVVFAVHDEGDGVVRVEGLDGVVRVLGRVERLLRAICNSIPSSCQSFVTVAILGALLGYHLDGEFSI